MKTILSVLILPSPWRHKWSKVSTVVRFVGDASVSYTPPDGLKHQMLSPKRLHMSDATVSQHTVEGEPIDHFQIRAATFDHMVVSFISISTCIHTGMLCR